MDTLGIIAFLIALLSFGTLAFATGRQYRLFENKWEDEEYYPPITVGPMKSDPEDPKTPPETPHTSETVPSITNREKLYQVAYSCLGKHMGLTSGIDKSVNCANALSHVLILAGVNGLPQKGIPGTAELYGWLLRSKQFDKMAEPLPGDILIYPTGYGNGSVRGHAFVVGKRNPMSNNSNTGLWDAHWDSVSEADEFYSKKGGIPRSVFRYID